MVKKTQQKRQNEPHRSQRRFQTLLNEGLHFQHVAGDPDAAAQKFREAVQAAPLVWTKHRFYAFVKGVAIQRFNEGEISKEEIELVAKQFVHNEKEPAHFRATAAYWMVQQYIEKDHILDRDNAAELIRLALDIIAQSPEEDGNRIVFHAPYVGGAYEDLDPSDYSLKKILPRIEEVLKIHLSVLEGKTPADVPNDADYERLRKRVNAGGRMCDCCAKPEKEIQPQKTLMRCSRCEMAYYCSAECQKEDWKLRGHRQACRKPGQIEVGDDMQLQCLVDGKDMVIFVKVLGRVEDEEASHRWLVKLYRVGGSNEVITVDGAKLRRIHPPGRPCEEK